MRFADYGAADGGTSAELWADLISSLRKGGDARHTELLYTDLPSNDFSTLFKTMQGMEGDPSNAYQINNDNIFVHGHAQKYCHYLSDKHLRGHLPSLASF